MEFTSFVNYLTCVENLEYILYEAEWRGVEDQLSCFIPMAS